MENGHGTVVPDSGHEGLPAGADFRGQRVFAVALKLVPTKPDILL